MNNTDYDEKYCTDWLIRGARNSIILFINHLKKENKIVLQLKDDIATMDPYEMKYYLKTLYTKSKIYLPNNFFIINNYKKYERIL